MSKQNQWIVGVNAVASSIENDAEHVREVLVEAGSKNPRLQEIEEKSFVKTVEEIYFVIESYETEKDTKMKAAYKIAFDEFEKYRNENPQLWQRIEEKYQLLLKAE